MSKTTIYCHTLNFQNRKWILMASERGMCRLAFEHDKVESANMWLHRYAPQHELIEDYGVFAEFGVIDLLETYFAGKPVSFEKLPLDVWGTPFQQQVWMGLARIPYGEVWTYKQLAEAINKPLAMRAVGTANGQNPLPLILPCHRVIGSNGTLTGYRGGLVLKQELLELEGIKHVAATGHERFVF
ncbi:MAG: methylated-DNA--[protein]-cysteine S-methyltransferase [Gorillibacterium sp.]|nr:methylated-DNA--[protein]-cysteine S-methyltransferase [Gorillibacterium sp.]